jgi:hypothetical protein
MHRVPLFTILGLGLTLGGCNGANTSESASESAGATDSSSSGGAAATNDPSNGTSQSASDPTTGVSGNSESATMGTTADVGGTAGPTTEDSTTAPDGDTTAAIDTTTDEGTTAASDGTTGGSSTGGPPDEVCLAPAMMVPCDSGDDVFKAIGLNCSDDPTVAIPIKNPVITAPDKTSYRVATRFGTAQDPMDPKRPAWGPMEGKRFLVLTTGKFPALKPDGALVENDDEDSESNNNPDELTQLPGVMKYEMGSNSGQGGTPFMDCDGTHDCSDTLEGQWNLEPNNVANDVFYMSFNVTTPPGTHGYLFDFVFFSEEYPVYVDTTFNDMFVVWSTSETFTGNVTFIEGQPLTVTALADYMTIEPGNPRLAGTGFPGDEEGAATEWFTAKASAEPGETFTIAISLFDMGDTVWDSVGILDNFRWDCQGCVPSEVDDCGVMPQ